MTVDLFEKNRLGRSIADRIDASGDCWLWTGTQSGPGREFDGGYGVINIGGRAGRQVPIHRVIWETLVGPIPDGLEIDHLCRVHNCVNPDHLEPVTHAENVRRGFGQGNGWQHLTHCKHGHEFTVGNTHVRKRDGARICRTCRRLATRKWRANREY